MAGYSIETITIALVGGVLPTLIWLWFWLRQDRKNPEPAKMIALSFIGGVLAPFIVLPLEYGIHSTLATSGSPLPWLSSGLFLLLAIAFVEELVKYGTARIVALRTRYFDEPIDGVVYLITVALGFAATENVFYLLDVFAEQTTAHGLITTHLRFLGATLLHVVSSASIGIAIALSYYRRKRRKLQYVGGGLLTATALHAAFNFSIIKTNVQTLNILFIFAAFWIIALVMIFFFEKIKRLKKPSA